LDELKEKCAESGNSIVNAISGSSISGLVTSSLVVATSNNPAMVLSLADTG
jgi:hypothetical protein